MEIKRSSHKYRYRELFPNRQYSSNLLLQPKIVPLCLNICERKQNRTYIWTPFRWGFIRQVCSQWYLIIRYFWYGKLAIDAKLQIIFYIERAFLKLNTEFKTFTLFFLLLLFLIDIFYQNKEWMIVISNLNSLCLCSGL